MKKRTNNLKIFAGASAGGHLNQLLRILNYSSDWPYKPSFFISTIQEVENKLAKYGKVYIIGEANRKNLIKAISIFIKTFNIAKIEKPDVVITTGSMPIAFFCFWAKIFGAKIIWIDSVANIENFSLSGRFVIHFADMFLTQWPELSKKNKKAEYVGYIL